VDSRGVASRYPDAFEDEVTAALAKLHGVKEENVILGCGSGEVLRMADMAFLGPGRSVVVAEPTFEAVLAFARVTRSEPVKVPLTPDHRHDLPRMAAACDAATGLVYLCNPNNPTGTIVSREEMDAFFGAVPGTAVILVDEAYHHFVEDPGYRSMTEALGRFPNLVVARTFSKVHGMAGMRLGYGLCSPENAKRLRERGFWGNLNAAVLNAGRESLADEAHVARQRELLNGTRRRLVAELQRDGRRTIPSEANFVMIEIGKDVEPLIAAFRERKILVGRRFPAMPSWLRVSLGTPAETTAFLAALRDLAPLAKAA
jgi:histidinol-phosphate aminotransferase